MNRSTLRAAALAALLSPVSLALVAGLALPAPAAAQEQRQADSANLPIRKITLYRSGVGYFQRNGLVDSGDKVQLRFATDQINDMLKSMVILDPQQALQSVGYGSKEPLSRRLGSFGVDLSDQPTLPTILSRLRGSRVKFVTPDGAVEGVILGVEVREQAQGAAQKPIAIPFINVVTSTGIKAVNLTTIAGVELTDQALNAELMKALSALGEHSVDRMKTVDLTFAGTGSREVIVAYVNDMPVWKTSYRLVLPDVKEGTKDPKNQGGQPTIQGWAIVENTTDEDWENVQLGLVAGRPVSFQMDLYEPLHVARPQIPVPTVPGVAPRVYQDASGFEDERKLAERAAAKSPPPAAMPGRSVGGAAVTSGLAASESRMRSVDRAEGAMVLDAETMAKYAAVAQAQAGEVGEVFEYQLKTPISISRQRSAMLPILSSAIDGRRISIYNRADGIQHPMRGVELKNTTGLQLIPGPISVFDGAAYAGDAQVGHITTGDKRLLAYAVDLDVHAVTKEENTSTIRRIKIVSGLLEQTSKQVYRIGYAFSNKDAKRPALLIEHAKMPGWDLVEPKKPAEETQNLYRFELALAPSEGGKLDVQLEHTEITRMDVTSYDFATLIAYVKEGKVSQAVVDAVKKAADMQAAINATQNRINQLDAEKQAIDQDQARIRQNMNSISRDTEIYRRYLTKFNDQETRLEAMKDQRDKEQATLNDQQRALEVYIRSLNVD